MTKENAEKYYYTKTKYPNYFVSLDEFKNSDKENRINLDEQIDEMYQFYQCRRGMWIKNIWKSIKYNGIFRFASK